MAVAIALTIFGAAYLVNIIAPPDMNDPLTKQGGLKSEQDIKRR
jgi:hypothetical protein